MTKPLMCIIRHDTPRPVEPPSAVYCAECSDKKRAWRDQLKAKGAEAVTQPPEIERLLTMLDGYLHRSTTLVFNDASHALAAVRAKRWVAAQHECPTDVGVTANCAPCEMAADAVTVCDVLRAENARMVDACRELKEERIAHHATLQREADAIAERDALRAEVELAAAQMRDLAADLDRAVRAAKAQDSPTAPGVAGGQPGATPFDCPQHGYSVSNQNGYCCELASDTVPTSKPGAGSDEELTKLGDDVWWGSTPRHVKSRVYNIAARLAERGRESDGRLRELLRVKAQADADWKRAENAEAERDALRAENERLRGVMEAAQRLSDAAASAHGAIDTYRAPTVAGNLRRAWEEVDLAISDAKEKP